MALPDAVRQATWRNGQIVARLGMPVTVCLFAAQATDNQRALARIWVAGYMAAVPPPAGAIDLGMPVEAQSDPDDPDDPDDEMRQVEDDHNEALLALLALWPVLAAPLVAALATGATQAAAAGLLGRLATLAVSGDVTRGITAAVTEALTRLATTSASHARDHLAGQGVEVGQPDVDRRDLRQQARAVTGLLVAGYRSAAARAGLNVADTDPDVIGRTVQRELDDLTTTAATQQYGQRRGLVANELASILHAAVHHGRVAVFRALDAAGLPVTWWADESNEDRSRCKPCSAIDREQFPTLAMAVAAYPAGKYVGCLGRQRCRGHLRARIRR